MLILCIVGNNWNYVQIMAIYVNLLDFRQTMGKNVEFWAIYVNFVFSREN